MKYDVREYCKEFHKSDSIVQLTNAKEVEQDKDLGLVAIIIRVLNKNKYDNIEDFIKRNNNYQDFLKNNNSDVVVLHFGNFNKHKITEADFTRVLNNLKILTNKKQQDDKENIKTTNIGDEQYNVYGDHFIDNSHSNKTIEEQMKDIQPTQQEFQTNDKKQNTENMFKELETKKEVLNLKYINEINVDILSNEEKELLQIAKDYEKNLNGNMLRIDLKRGILVDQTNSIMKIEKNNGEFSVIKEDNGVEKEVQKEKTYQKILTPSKNTIYNN